MDGKGGLGAGVVGASGLLCSVLCARAWWCCWSCCPYAHHRSLLPPPSAYRRLVYLPAGQGALAAVVVLGAVAEEEEAMEQMVMDVVAAGVEEGRWHLWWGPWVWWSSSIEMLGSPNAYHIA